VSRSERQLVIDAAGFIQDAHFTSSSHNTAGRTGPRCGRIHPEVRTGEIAGPRATGAGFSYPATVKGCNQKDGSGISLIGAGVSRNGE